jgi:4-amino-4-deoxy-L-arabinose transferase-like glycosyltransferase
MTTHPDVLSATEAADATLSAPSAKRGPLVPRALGHLLASTFVLALAWAFVTPAFQAPDENTHFAYVQSLADGPGLPGTANRPIFSTEQTLASDNSNADQAAQQGNVKMEWSSIAYERWRARARALPSSARSDGGGPIPAASNPPLYYVYDVGAYKAAAAGDIFDRLFVLRAASMLWLLVTVTAVWLLAAEVFGSDRLLQLAAASLAGMAPMLTFLSASVTPDAMMFALWSLVLWLGVRAIKRGLTLPLAFALFGLVGAACCVKSTSYSLIPAAVLVLAVGLGRQRPRRLASTLAIVGGAVVALALTIGVWKLVAAGADRPVSSQLTAATATDGASPRMMLSYLWQFYLPRLPFQDDFAFPGSSALPVDYIWLQGVWGAFGWLEVTFPAIVNDMLRVLTVAVFAAAVVTLWRTRRRTDWAVAAFLVLVTLTLLAGLHWTEYQQIARGGGPLTQGRYLLPLVGVAGLVVAHALRVLPARMRPQGAATLIGALLVLQFAALGLMLDRFYA